MDDQRVGVDRKIEIGIKIGQQTAGPFVRPPFVCAQTGTGVGISSSTHALQPSASFAQMLEREPGKKQRKKIVRDGASHDMQWLLVHACCSRRPKRNGNSGNQIWEHGETAAFAGEMGVLGEMYPYSLE
jgi:hypothetical protein